LNQARSSQRAFFLPFSDWRPEMESSTFKPEIYLYDTTLRDGTQRKGISLSLGDKMKIAKLLDEFGIPYIECGWPGSNPKDAEFFRRAPSLHLKQAKLVAFGSTRRKNSSAASDPNIEALLQAETPAVAVVGKSWTLHVERVLETNLAENIAMIEDSVFFLRNNGREVIYDAEHFFDGFRADPEYALRTITAAAQAGAEWAVMCDTNGGSTPDWIFSVVTQVRERISAAGLKTNLGIHTHNDAELAVANSLAAVEAGCTQIQGTINGYGERCGNANLISIAPTLELKRTKRCLPLGSLSRLSEVSRTVSEIANLIPDTQAPYVGSSAFAHKGGIHVAAVEKVAASYEHIAPEIVGNRREIVVSELSGKGNVRVLARQLGYSDSSSDGAVLNLVKDLESKGFQFENAQASFELLLRREQLGHEPPFEVLNTMVVSEGGLHPPSSVRAMTKVKIGDRVEHTASEGDGPVHALDGALRKALLPVYPELAQVFLTDYKVRILDPNHATAAITRVTLDARYHDREWTTVGCSENIVQASLQALSDSLEYFLARVLSEQDSSLIHAERALG